MIPTKGKIRGLVEAVRAAHRQECQADVCQCVTIEEHDANLRPVSPSLDPVRQQVMEKLEKALRLKTFGIYLCADIPHAGPCRERFPRSAGVWCENCAREAARDEAIREALDLLKQEGSPR